MPDCTAVLTRLAKAAEELCDPSSGTGAVSRYVALAREAIDDWIRHYVAEEIPEPLAERVLYAVMGGKRLRGALVLLYAHTEGAREPPLDLAAAVEMAHSASLVHDDVADGSGVRRGRPSFWVRYGLGEAVTVPHVLISSALSVIGGRGVGLLRKSIEGWRLASLGQYYDLLARSGEVDIEYKELVRLKSGVVFATACYIGSSAAGGDADRAYDFGMRLGVAYQALDDAVSILQGTSDSGSASLALSAWGSSAVEELVDLAAREVAEALRAVPPRTRRVLALFAKKTLNDISSEAGGELAETVSRRIALVAGGL